MTARVEHGDSRAVLPTLAADSIDSCVTDPPYALVGTAKPRPDLTGKDNAYARRQSKMGGFMGKQWDTGETAFDPASWAEVLRVLKPGAHLLAFGGTRSYHRLACAIEDAGFEIRDQIGWLYGSGFPKSHDVSKGIDKAAGAEREVVGVDAEKLRPNRLNRGYVNSAGGSGFHPDNGATITAPATEAARQWAGWGTALKPAWEPIVLARKPLIGTVAANVLEHGTGAINVDGCRVVGAAGDGVWSQEYGHTGPQARSVFGETISGGRRVAAGDGLVGRWPANVIHDGSEEVLEAFGRFGEKTTNPAYGTKHSGAIWGTAKEHPVTIAGSSGTAARFFYTAKADAADRLQSKHPTVKPVDLIAYLCRLITPPGGTVLDCFAGSGTTAMACIREGFDCILIEREAEYVADIQRRLAHVSGGDTPLFADPPPKAQQAALALDGAA